MTTGIGGKLRSALTSRRWLTRALTPGAALAQRWHFPLADFGGTSSGASADSASLFGTEAAAVTTTGWEALAGALGYGYGLYWLVVIEGWPTIHLEALGDAIPPAGYDVDATLVIDRTAPIGPVIDGDTHIAKGFDVELRFLDSPAVRALMRQPARYTYLTQHLGADDLICWVETTNAFAGLSEFYIGTSCVKFGGRQGNAFLLLDRDGYGERRFYPKGTIVTDGPYELAGRRVDLRAVLIDPSGAYVQGSSILSKAPVMWSGYIAERPVRDGPEWVMQVRDQVRRIADPIGVAASGTAIWSPDDDALVEVPRMMRVHLEVALLTTGTVVSAHVQPFRNMSTTARASLLRKAVVDALTEATTIGTGDGQVIGYAWRPRPVVGSTVIWDLVIQLNPAPGDTLSVVVSNGLSNAGAGFGLNAGSRIFPCADTAGFIEHVVDIWHASAIHGAALSVVLDKATPSSLPTAGNIVIEGAGLVDYASYTSLEVDAGDPRRVNLTLDAGDRPTGQTALDAISAEAPSVRFLWSDRGRLADILRRALASTGNAQHGVWDTLPRGQGLGLPELDEESFDAVFGGGAFGALDFQIAADSGTSIAKLFDGLFRLARRALVTRRRADGGACEVAAVDIGAVDSGVPVATITERLLIARKGRRPVRVKSTYAVPQAIQITCRTIPAGDLAAGEAVIDIVDPHLTQWTRTKWNLDVHGVSRDAIKNLAIGWATSWFRAGETRQLIELDVPPTVTAQVGDIVALDLPDASLWDYATGLAGYVGLARVIGATLAPTSAVVTLHLAIDGVLGSGPMSPSIPIVEVFPVPTAPDYIAVPEKYFDLLTRAKGDAATWKLLAYRPGQDAGRAEYTVSTLTLTSGVCRITVVTPAALPGTVSLTTAYRLTWPVASQCTDGQDEYLHNTDVVQWG